MHIHPDKVLLLAKVHVQISVVFVHINKVLLFDWLIVSYKTIGLL